MEKRLKLILSIKQLYKRKKDRIVNSGRRITNGRIDGRINLTRSIGDFQYKNNYSLKDNQQAVIPCPEIYKFKITSDIEFMIMGCDGLWDYVDPQKLCEFVSKKLKEKTPIKNILNEISSKLITKNLDTNIGSDNMTCLIIEFKNE